MKTRRALLTLTLGNVLLATLLFALHPHGSEFGRLWSVLHLNLGRDDSSSFLEAACTTTAAGKPVYRELFFEHGFKFIYPPSSMLTCGVASAFGMRLATLINVLALVSTALTFLLAGDLFLLLCPGEKTWQVRTFVAGFGLLFSPLIFAVYLGQIQAWLDLLFTFAVWSWMRDGKGWAGASLALVCVFKPPLAFFLLWAVLRREWRFLAVFTGVVALFQAAAIARFGWQSEFDYLRVLAYLSRHGEVLVDNQSVNGLLERWVGNGVGKPWTPISHYPAYNAFVYYGTMATWAVLLGFGLLWPKLRKWQDRATDFLVFGLLATVASPIAWTHHYGWFYVGCIYLLAMSLKQRNRLPWWCMACMLVLANTWIVLAGLEGTRWNPVLSYDLFAGLGVIAGLAFWVRHRPGSIRPSAIVPGR